MIEDASTNASLDPDSSGIYSGSLLSDLAQLRGLLQQARGKACTAYCRFTQVLDKAQARVQCVADTVEQLLGPEPSVCGDNLVADKLQAAHRLLFRIDLASGGTDALTRLRSLLDAQSLGKALIVAANILAAKDVSQVDREKVSSLLSEWEEAQKPGALLPLTLPIDQWQKCAFPEIYPIAPVPLLEDTTKLFSLYIQELAQQVDRVFAAAHLAHSNVDPLSIVRQTNRDSILEELCSSSVQSVLVQVSSTLTRSVEAILDKFFATSVSDVTLNLSERSLALDYLQLMANLTARLLELVQLRTKTLNEAVPYSLEAIIAPYESVHQEIVGMYTDMETSCAPPYLVSILCSSRPEQFEGTAVHIFHRIRGLEHTAHDVVAAVEDAVAYQTLAGIKSSHHVTKSLQLQHLGVIFASSYARGNCKDLMERVKGNFTRHLDEHALVFVTRSQPAIRLLAQVQDATVFIDNLTEMLETDEELDDRYIDDYLTCVMNHTSLALANVLIKAPIPLSQVPQLRRAFKDVAEALRTTLTRPVVSMCYPLLALYSILSSQTLEEAASCARGTLLEPLCTRLIQSHGVNV